MKAFLTEFVTFVNENRIVSGVVTTVVASILLSIWKENPTWFFFSILVLFGIIVLFFWYSRQNTPDKTVPSENKAPQNFQLPPKETPSEHKAGEVKMFALPGGVELEMVYCPAGRFTMGSPDGKSEYPLGSGIDPKAELGRWDEEIPHEVTLTEGFWIGKYPVTQAQYKAITGENPANFNGDTRPVEMVSWRDSVAFCERLNELRIAPKGYRFVLPTEAQWEYACRAETATALNNGKPITSKGDKCPSLDEVGWYYENSGVKTHPVGQKRPNGWGIYDMHGNVWEWCADRYGAYPRGAVTDPEGPKTGGDRVLRGGSWLDPARSCRSADRNDDGPDYCSINHGFRLALVPEQKTASA